MEAARTRAVRALEAPVAHRNFVRRRVLSPPDVSVVLTPATASTPIRINARVNTPLFDGHRGRENNLPQHNQLLPLLQLNTEPRSRFTDADDPRDRNYGWGDPVVALVPRTPPRRQDPPSPDEEMD